MGDDADLQALAVQLHLLGQEARDELDLLRFSAAGPAAQALGHEHRPAGIAREDGEIQQEGWEGCGRRQRKRRHPARPQDRKTGRVG